MNTELTFTQEQVQKLSAAQFQSLQILAMSSEDLRSLLQKESEENPFLDYHPVSSRGGAAEFLRFVAAPENDRIKHFILDQLNPAQFDKSRWALLTYLAQCVDTHGYLQIDERTIRRLPFPKRVCTEMIGVLQSLNPPGICALSPADCLKIQLRRRHALSPLTETIIDNYLDDVGKNRISAIAAALGLSKAQIQLAIRIIKSLDPFPLKGFFDPKAAYAVPDIIIRRNETSYEIILNDSWTNSYSMSSYYMAMMRQTNDADIKTYFQQKYARCSLLLHHVERRRQTLASLAQAVCLWQYGYIRRHQSLRPMTLKDIAQASGFHISTVSRAVKDKYIQTPWETLPFKALFQGPLRQKGRPVSKDAVKRSLTELIAAEDKENPYSDAQLTALLSEHFGTSISRRVIQKYRNLLHIPNSYKRRPAP